MATLYSYWRSSAAYRVRIALNLKGIKYDLVSVDLKPGTAEHHAEDYALRNPQKLVPFFEDDRVTIGQSMAILEYLEERYPEPPLLPLDPQLRGEVRSVCQHIACDVHPLNNLGVLLYLSEELGISDAQRDQWYAHWIHRVFDSIEPITERHAGPYVFGEQLTLADVLLVPQVYNAQRFNVPLDNYPGIVWVTDYCNRHAAFDQAKPESQPDAE
ncbi:MAG: maleylacetoacetate isomerase [Woeseiaceae bacterium]|nr:maleylacetoacetate isomerase [Woeseiaceae bacterium]